jgi:hypothetical protein
MEQWNRFLDEGVTVYIHGYVKPASAFHTIGEWETFANQILKFQKGGESIRGGTIDGSSELVGLIKSFYNFQLDVEVSRYDLLTYKNVLDHVEDFINHRVWGLRKEFEDYFPDINKLRLAYFYSRGDMEPYILIDDEFTEQIYGSNYNPKKLLHYTTAVGVRRIKRAIETGETFDVSSYTVAERPFFRKDSNLIMEFEGNVRAGFRSDVKSFSVDNGRKCVNLYRLGYPGEDKDNLCTDLNNDCNGELKTSLWNEFIATPIKVLGISKI